MGNVINMDEGLEPIQVVIDGTTYQVGAVSEAMMENVMSTSQESGDSQDLSVLSRQLGTLLGVSSETFRDTDIRKVSGALTAIMGALTGEVRGPLGNS